MAERAKHVNPSVLTALKVLCEASEDDLMDALEEFRVAHRSRLAALFGQSVAEGLDAFKQHGDASSYDPAALAEALFWDLPAGPDSPSDDDGRPRGSGQVETLWLKATLSARRQHRQQMIQVREAARQTMANMAACPADTGSLFGGSPAQPAKGAVFGGKGRTADPSGAISKAKAKGDAPPKKTHRGAAAVSRQFGAKHGEGPSDAAAASQSGPPPGYYRGWTGNFRGAAVPVNTEDDIRTKLILDDSGTFTKATRHVPEQKLVTLLDAINQVGADVFTLV